MHEPETEQTPLAGDATEVVAAFEHVPAIIWFFTGPDAVVAAANAAARASAGNRPGIVGRPIAEVLPELEGQQLVEVIAHVFATQAPMLLPERRVLVDRDGDGKLEEAITTVTFVPVWRPDGSVRGVLGHAIEITDTVRERQRAQEQAHQAEQRYRGALDVALTLQRALLPDSLPVLPGTRLAAHYVVAGTELAAGGDWFDALPLGDGRVALLVGDVVGHGAAAAAAMGQLRAVALRALLAGCGIADTLAELDAFARRIRQTRAATLVIAVLDVRSGHLEHASCAHPPPLVVDPAGHTRFVTIQPGRPLGTDGPSRPVAVDRLQPGEAVLLYSDGLIERPQRSLAEGLEELATTAAAAARITEQLEPGSTVPATLPDRICTLLAERFAWTGYGDDVTLLAAERLTAPCGELDVTAPAAPPELTRLRHALAGWLAGLDTRDEDRFVLTHAAGEAISNAIEHAYPSPAADTQPNSVRLRGALDDHGQVVLTVMDHGHWRSASSDPAGRGRGLAMMRSLVDTVEVDVAPPGTTVTLRHELRRPVVVGDDSAVPVPENRPETDEFATQLLRSENPVLCVSGPVDISTVGRLGIAILDASRGGALPLSLDLTDVTHLASAGVRLLHDLMQQAADDRRIDLYAAAGSRAHHVLVLTGLQHVTTSTHSTL